MAEKAVQTNKVVADLPESHTDGNFGTYVKTAVRSVTQLDVSSHKTNPGQGHFALASRLTFCLSPKIRSKGFM